MAKKTKCPVCEKELQNPKSKRHINSNDHQNALKKLGKKNTESGVVVSSSLAQMQELNLKERVSNLEQKFKYLVQKIDNLELTIIKTSSKTNIINSNTKLKNKISKILRTGDSLSIDEVMMHSDVKTYPWEVVEQTLLTMVDEEILDISEGSSRLKIENKYGRIIKR